MAAFKKVALIFNPAAGLSRKGRREAVEAAAGEFRSANVDVELVPTRAAGAASEQALAAIAAGCDAIIACGGDGTVHEVMQGMVEEKVNAALGVIPLGTGNGLAAELRMPRQPKAAARWLLRATPRRIAVGRVECGQPATRARYWIISAGVGADAEMLYGLATDQKARYGKAAYYAHAIKLFAQHDFVPFACTWRDAKGEHEHVVAQVMAARIADFGGLISRLAPGASLLHDDMRLVIFHGPGRWPVLVHSIGATVRRQARVRGLDFASATEMQARVLTGPPKSTTGWRADRARRIYVQADGEVLGTLPARFSVVPDAVRLLM